MIKVLKAGFYTTIQDSGRVGFSEIGVPVSGVMDLYSTKIANSILNNSLDDAVIEITFGGCELQFFQETTICISGGDFSPKINQQNVKLNQKIKVSKNDIVSFGNVKYGVRCYLAVSGGVQSEKILNSRSYYRGITKEFLLKKGMEIPIIENVNNLETSNSSIKIEGFHFNSKELKCYKGPEFEMLEHQQKQLFEQKFTISKDNNRMGYRLKEVIKNALPSILTSSVLPGTVQLTPSGKLIILMRDCQVTGGYPRVLQLSEASINSLSQKGANQNIRFTL